MTISSEYKINEKEGEEIIEYNIDKKWAATFSLLELLFLFLFLSSWMKFQKADFKKVSAYS